MGDGGGREREFWMFFVRCKYVTVCLKKGGRRRRGESERERGGQRTKCVSVSLFPRQQGIGVHRYEPIKKKNLLFPRHQPPPSSTKHSAVLHST